LWTKNLHFLSYSSQRMPSCSNTSHDRYKSGTQLWWRLYHTTEWLFSGNGGDGRELLSPKGGSSRYMTTLNEEYKCCVTYCSPLASVVCTLLDVYLICNGHVRYCYNLESVVHCKLSQLNLSETTGLNGTKFFFGELIIELKNTSMA
jgi:hypothetical protein